MHLLIRESIQNEFLYTDIPLSETPTLCVPMFWGKAGTHLPILGIQNGYISVQLPNNTQLNISEADLLKLQDQKKVEFVED